MNHEEAKIKARLEEVLESIFCPVGGCWCMHGAHYEYYYDEGCECHVLEVWPVGFHEADEEGGNGRQPEDICYEWEKGDWDNIRGRQGKVDNVKVSNVESNVVQKIAIVRAAAR